MNSQPNETIFLMTFLQNEEFNQKAMDPSFCNYVSAQKDLIAQLLVNGYQMQTGQGNSPINVPMATMDTPMEILQVPMPVPASSNIVEPAEAKDGQVLGTLTTIFATLTGYPEDMLEPDLDLEADLGIDTVKQMEILAVIKEKYKSVGENFNLSTTPTIRSIAEKIVS